MSKVRAAGGGEVMDLAQVEDPIEDTQAGKVTLVPKLLGFYQKIGPLEEQLATVVAAAAAISAAIAAHVAAANPHPTYLTQAEGDALYDALGEAAAALAIALAALAAQKLNEHVAPDGSVEFAQQQALQFVVECRTDDPPSPVDGQIWLRTDL